MGKAQVANQTYLVVTTVKHDGDLYQNGDTIQLTEEQAAPLLAGGAIMQEEGPAKQRQQKQAPPQDPPQDPPAE